MSSILAKILQAPTSVLEALMTVWVDLIGSYYSLLHFLYAAQGLHKMLDAR